MHEIALASGAGLKGKREIGEMAGKGRPGKAWVRHTLGVERDT